MPVRVGRRAQADLNEIHEYLYRASGSEAVADRVISEIAERFLLLSRWPRIGRLRTDLRAGLRSYPVGSHLIFYRVTRVDVVIVRILHGRRNLPRCFVERGHQQFLRGALRTAPYTEEAARSAAARGWIVNRSKSLTTRTFGKCCAASAAIAAGS